MKVDKWLQATATKLSPVKEVFSQEMDWLVSKTIKSFDESKQDEMRKAMQPY